MVAVAAPIPATRDVVADGTPIVLYDGTCGLCAKSVRFILDHERDSELMFAPLQGPTAAALRAKYGNIPSDIDTVVFVDGERAHLRSKAFMYLSKHLQAPYRWMHGFRWLPGFVLNGFYRIVAAVRYKLWGQVDACELPSPANRKRFLE